MKIAIGPTNQTKVDALRELILEYALVSGAEVISADVPSNVSEQPKSIGETAEGAMNRAHAAFPWHDLNFGVGSGLIRLVPPKARWGF
jgi:non-canonical (house-cleaning) NTP pyrophosphatase